MDPETLNYLVTKIRMLSSQIVWIMETLFNAYMYALQGEKIYPRIKAHASLILSYDSALLHFL